MILDHSAEGFWNMVLGSIDWAHGGMEHHRCGNTWWRMLFTTQKAGSRETGGDSGPDVTFKGTPLASISRPCL